MSPSIRTIKGTEFRLRFGPRGALRCTATIAEAPGEDPRFGKWGKQSCTDTGPLTKKRMETVDEEFLSATLYFIDRANRDGKPFFAWFNSTRMHIWTRLKAEAQGKTGLGIYPDGMVEHDGQVGQLLKKLDDLGIANNTIVIYTTDNGAETFTLAGRRHHAVPRREEHQLGGQLPGAGDHPLARPGAAAQRDQSNLLGGGLGADADGGRWASPTSRRSS
jgi:arylsulfatase A-like enzyme